MLGGYPMRVKVMAIIIGYRRLSIL